jgi:UDP-N-acetylmuramyl pentapeptide phosphotransferase/UDP-N-acetylglucosamine-1-phosphate transferase
VIAIALTPVSKWLAPHMGLVAHPRARDIHTRPVPRLGGLAILVGVLAMAVLLGQQPAFQQLAAIVIGATLMSFMGLVDDRFQLNAYVKLGFQVGVAVMAYLFDVRVMIFSSPLLDGLLTVLWIVGITNAMNMLDNMDGLLAGVSAVIAAFFTVLAAINGQYLVSLLSAAVLGACLGFLFWNLNPASVFMGDSGSMFLGFLLACIAIKLRFIGQTPAVSWMVPVIVMGLPIFDTTLVTLSRLRRGKNPLTSPGKDHSSHRIANHGFSKREAVMILYLVCGALGVIAIIASVANIVASFMIAISLLAVGAYMLWFMEFGPWKLTTIDWETTPPSTSQRDPQAAAPINTSPS